MKSNISIVIPNFNGVKLLTKHIAEVLKAAGNSEVIVVDDGSTDESVQFLKEKYPQVRVIIKKTNTGFSSTVNLGVKKAKGEWVVLLNNDVRPKADLLKFLIPHFTNAQVFSVGAMEIDGKKKRGRSRGFFQRGLVMHQAHPRLELGPTLWTFAAAAAYRKSMWEKLGGMDIVYEPGYWEDIDICYRAWKAGWTCLFEPKAQVHHQAESTFGQWFNQRQRQILAYRNQLLFTWKNITDWQMKTQIYIWLIYHICITTWHSEGAFLTAFWQALQRIKQLQTENRALTIKTDRDILRQFGDV